MNVTLQAESVDWIKYDPYLHGPIEVIYNEPHSRHFRHHTTHGLEWRAIWHCMACDRYFIVQFPDEGDELHSLRLTRMSARVRLWWRKRGTQ